MYNYARLILINYICLFASTLLFNENWSQSEITFTISFEALSKVVHILSLSRDFNQPTDN